MSEATDTQPRAVIRTLVLVVLTGVVGWVGKGVQDTRDATIKLQGEVEALTEQFHDLKALQDRVTRVEDSASNNAHRIDADERRIEVLEGHRSIP